MAWPSRYIVNIVIFLTILFGLYTIYDHQEKYKGELPAKPCRTTRTANQPRSHFSVGAPTSVETGEVTFDRDIFNSTENLDEMLESTMEKHFGDIRTNAFEILDQYGRLTDENTLFDLKSSVRSFMAKSKIISDLREMHKELQRLKLEAPCQQVNVTEINLFYRKIDGKITEFNRLDREIQQIHNNELDENNRLYNSLTEHEWEKTKEQSNLAFLKQELQSNQQTKRRPLTVDDIRFMDNFHKEEKFLEERIQLLQQQLIATGVSAFQASQWNSDTVKRAREVIRFQIKDLPLIHRVNVIKDSIQTEEDLDRDNPMLADDLVRERERLQEIVDQKFADSVYHDIIKNYLGRIRKLVELKYEGFKKEKIRDSQEELERKDAELLAVEQYIRLVEQISKLTKELQNNRIRYNETLSLKENDAEANKEQIRHKIRASESRIVELQTEINRLKSLTGHTVDREKLNSMIAEADRLRNEIEPEYQVYNKRVHDASKVLSDCRIERIKLEGKIDDLRHRIQDAYSRLGSYNENIGTILTIIDDKVPDKVPDRAPK